MRKISLAVVALSLLLLTGCELSMAPSEYWRDVFGTESDSAYYKDVSERLVKRLSKVAKEYDINKVAVFHMVDEKGRVPVLGEYMSARLVEELARKKYFRVAQQGEVEDVLNGLNLKPAGVYKQEQAMKIGEALNTEALITGQLTDIGANIDVRIMMVDIISGEVIASATEGMDRTRFAVEMLRHF